MGTMRLDFALSAGPMLSSRSSASPLAARGLSSGGIAGAVLGSVLGAMLVVCCFPVVLRAWRRRRRGHTDPFDPEPAQRKEGHGIRIQQGLPSAISPRSLPAAEFPGVTRLPSAVHQPVQQNHQDHGRIRFPRVPDAVKRIFHPPPRRASKASSTGCLSEAARSQTIDFGDPLIQAEPESAPAVHESYEVETRGEAWSYYHPNLQEPEEFVVTTVPAVPEAVSPDSDKTVSALPARHASRSSVLWRQRKGVQRMDSLGPQDIVSDIPNPPGPSAAEPSASPMDIMRPTTDREHQWMVEQEIVKYESSPPPQPIESRPQVPWSKKQEEKQQDFFADAVLPDADADDGGLKVHVTDVDMGESPCSVATPLPWSSGPSLGNTPDTGMTYSEPYTASPSPVAPLDTADLGHKPDAESQAEFGSSQPMYPPTYPSGMDHPPNSSYLCEQCGRSFDQVHKLK